MVSGRMPDGTRVRVGDLALPEAVRILAGTGLWLGTGAFVVHLRTDSAARAGAVVAAHADHRVSRAPAIHDFPLTIARTSGRFGLPARRPGVQARIDGEPLFEPFPEAYAFAMFESTLNWCIARYVHRHLTFHAGAVEREGRAVILTGPSGSGKSTLCAALSQGGWRLLSDELVLLDLSRKPGVPGIPEIIANPRPISLKNEAIDRIAARNPQARFSARFENTVKGTIAFVHPRPEAVRRAGETVAPALVVAPTYRPGADLAVEEIAKAAGFMMMVENAVNYFTTGRPGFEALAALSDRSRFYRLTYGDIDQAVAAITELHATAGGGGAA
ncbi:MAG: HprK-related kinase A [Alphaproteobacteria bacterium]|nr:MAG: HprK-related kinase A [Alphaproteobacteria bacterium]